MRLVAVTCVGLVTGCGDSGGGSDSADAAAAHDGGLDASVGAALSRFNTSAQTWSVPPSGLTPGFYSPSSDVSPGFWKLLDLDGDGKRDLVQTADTSGSVWDKEGAPHWRVYENTGSGFASDVTIWPVPAVEFARGAYTDFVASGATNWVTIDLDGDGRQDFVVTTDPATGAVWDYQSASHWRVYLNTGTGFAETPTTWSLPIDPSPSGVSRHRLVSTAAGVWATTDIDGDGKVDLVVTADAGNPLTVWGTQEEPFWKVYPNTGAGFGTELSWRVPELGSASGFFDIVGSRWSTVDIDLDGEQELVHTASLAFPPEVLYESARPVWRVYDVAEGGFAAAPVLWSVPLSSNEQGFFLAENNNPSLEWKLLDLDADNRLDLIHTAVTGRSDSIVWGFPLSDQWKVYFGAEGGGFRREVFSWTVPDSGSVSGFFSAENVSGANHWATIDLDGDGVLELVQTADPTETPAQVWDAGNAPHWKVYTATR